MLVDDVLQIVDFLARRVRDQHNVSALLADIVGGIRTENGDPECWMWLLDGCYCDACVLHMVVEAVIGERFAFPGL